MLGCHVDRIALEVEPERSKYLGDPSVSDEIRNAIESGLVIEGMCPQQAFAAAGRPGPFMVLRDESIWDSSVAPPVIVSAQCEKPDASTVHLVFRNVRQFPDAKAFRVRFEAGKAVAIAPLEPVCER